MQNYWWCAILFRIVLPISICVAVSVRPTITSYVYLLMGLYLPFFSVPTQKSMAGATGVYMKLLMVVCLLICTFVVSFYMALFFPTREEYDLEPCSTMEHILRTAGVVEFLGLSLGDTICWCLPEPLMLVTSVGLYATFNKFTQETEVMRATAEMEGDSEAEELKRKKLMAVLVNFGKYVVVLMFCVAGVLKVSVLGGIYYFAFLIILTYWACNQSLGKIYARILIGFLPVICLHLTILYGYQFQLFQDMKVLAPEELYGRLFQWERIHVYKDCKDPRQFKWLENFYSTYAHPYILFILFHLCVLVSKETLQAKDGFCNLMTAVFKHEERLSGWPLAIKLVQRKIEEDKINKIDENLWADKIRVFVERFIQLIIRNSYLVANFIMMIWAITYIGWKTLVILIWSNIMWLLPSRRKVMLATSPILIVWVWFMLVTGYLYSLDVYIPYQFGIFNLASGHSLDEGIVWANLLIKSLYSVIIFITMRQFLQERAEAKKQKALAEALGVSLTEAVTDLAGDQAKPGTWKKLQTICRNLFALCWIWVVVLTMIWMEFIAVSNPFRITFVALAILLIMTFQLCSFRIWKKFISVYWWIVIVYAMFNLFVVYMYQLEVTRKFLYKYVSSKAAFDKLGFEAKESSRDRLNKLIHPIFFQIAIVIQQHYLQKDFNRLTAPVSPEEIAEQEKEFEALGPRWKKVIGTIRTSLNFVYTFLEIHIQKISLMVGWGLCDYDWCAFFFPFVVLLTFSCILGRNFTSFTLYLMSTFVQVLIVARLIFMNQYTEYEKWNYVGYYERNGKIYNTTLNTLDWLGFNESQYGRGVADIWLVDWCFIFVFFVTLERMVSIRQYNYRKSRNLPTAPQKIMYPDINFRNCHENTKNMCKFIINYGFYKLGVELTAVLCSVIMMMRMDFIAILQSIVLLVTFSLNRKWMERILLPLMICVAVMVPFQYLNSLGYWPTYWKQSYTDFWNKDDLRVRFQQFCHLMNMAHPPKKAKISWDFFLLMCLSRQWRAFRVARMFKDREFGAGDNNCVAHLIDEENVDNPVPDFVTYTRNYLDIYKRIIFSSWFYLSLLATFLAGVMRPNIYSFGYILLAFYLVWEGSDMFLRPPANIMLRWNLLILYNALIMAFRTVSNMFGCILIYQFQHANCKLYSMFTVGCVDKFGMFKDIPNMRKTMPCQVDYDSLGLEWDCFCFFFLIMQQRIFKSFHFFHIVNDAKARTILAKGGANLIEEQRYKKRKAVDSLVVAIRQNIRTKLDRYKAVRQKIQGDVYLKRKKNHKQTLRSGDYYLFDDVDKNLDVPLLPPKQEEVDTEFDPYDPMYFTEFWIYTFKTGDINKVLEERALRHRQKQARKEGKKAEDLRKAVVSKRARPGTSKALEQEVFRETTKIMRIMLFSWGIVESVIVSFTAILNSLTKDFTAILNEMDKDSKILKEKTKYASEGIRIGSFWCAGQDYTNILNAQKGKASQQPRLHYTIYGKLLGSISNLLMSKSEWMCYLVIILNQVLIANFISLPLPLMVFCWGSLTVPKPTKTFWVIIIAYALIMSIIKNFFVMEIADWNEFLFPENHFFPPTVIGVDRYINSLFNLILLCALFFHRVVLQSLGLWEPFYYRPISLIQNGDYNLKDGHFVPITKGEPTNKNTLSISSGGVPFGDYFPSSIAHGVKKYAESFRLFTQQLISPSSTQIPVDVYTPMFWCDLINLLLIVFFYKYFVNIETEELGLLQFIQNNTVPIAFILIFTSYCFLMVLDRWIYLRKNRFAKLMYLYFQVMCFHVWFFVAYPMMTGRIFRETSIVQLFFVLKCFYFLFSAHQIRSGYPQLISCHCMMHGTTLLHRYLFKSYTMIPYLYELRSLLDWTCVDTSLNVDDFFKLEEITQNMFDQKCQQEFEASVGTEAGERQSRTKKYIIGGIAFTILFLTIIFPFFLFSLSSTVGVKTHPNRMYLELYMGTAEPIFQSYASQRNLVTLSEKDYQNLTKTFSTIKASETLFGSFEAEDIVVTRWSSHSLSTWPISPGSLKDLIRQLRTNQPLSFRVQIRYTHVGSGGDKSERVFGQSIKILPAPDVARPTLLKLFENDNDTSVIALPLVFPKFLLITKEAKPKALPLMEDPGGGKMLYLTHAESVFSALDGLPELRFASFVQLPSRAEKYHFPHLLGEFDAEAYDIVDTVAEDEDDDEDMDPSPRSLRNLLISLRREEGQMWWEIREECNPEDDNYAYYLKDLVHNSCDQLVIYTFNEKVFSGTMHLVTGEGILGLYFLYFMVVFSVLRSLMIEVGDIWFEDLPNADRILRKCREIYIARDMENYELEEELFAELIFIMRSREICIKLTRYEDDPYNPNFLTPGARRQ